MIFPLVTADETQCGLSTPSLCRFGWGRSMIDGCHLNSPPIHRGVNRVGRDAGRARGAAALCDRDQGQYPARRCVRPSGGGLRSRVLLQPLPIAWRQLQHPSRGVCRDALKDTAQIQERIVLQVLAGLHERPQDGRAVCRRFAARKQIIFPVMPRTIGLSACSPPLLSILMRPSSV